jgi:DNA polymerase III delta subunit
MFTLIHGEDVVKSRQCLQSMVNIAKSKGAKEILDLDGRKIDLTSALQAIETTSFFSDQKLVVIDRFFSRPKSNLKTEICQYFKKNSQDPQLTPVIFWEPKTITPAQIKTIGQVEVKSFALPKEIFNFLNQFQAGNRRNAMRILDLALSQNEPELLYYLLVKQIRQMLKYKSNLPINLAPWQLKRLQQQAGTFSLNQLQQIYSKLLQIETDTKTGKSLLTLRHHLEILVAML